MKTVKTCSCPANELSTN